ncbi:hypothetical protein HHI36_001639 [Cryptolaemus montrouzieri]|uniref:Uncharacterized protein n=1 Tax=Cryptolaemus montrouzieri TaxID=559131 RepID=A0ABD2P8D7_9CUCU
MVLDRKPLGKKKLGRPRMRWAQKVSEDARTYLPNSPSPKNSSLIDVSNRKSLVEKPPQRQSSYISVLKKKTPPQEQEGYDRRAHNSQLVPSSSKAFKPSDRLLNLRKELREDIVPLEREISNDQLIQCLSAKSFTKNEFEFVKSLMNKLNEKLSQFADRSEGQKMETSSGQSIE